MTAYYEHIDLALRPKTLQTLEPVIRAAAEAEWEDDAVRTELMNLANDIASRLQRLEKGNFQKAISYEGLPDYKRTRLGDGHMEKGDLQK